METEITFNTYNVTSLNTMQNPRLHTVVYKANILQSPHAAHSHISQFCFQVLDKPVDNFSPNETRLIRTRMVAPVFHDRWLFAVQPESHKFARYYQISLSRTAAVVILSHWELSID